MNDFSQKVTGATLAGPPRTSLHDHQALIRECRPELPADTPEFQGALLLLLIDTYGMNVERLVRRSGLPRDFVARGVRRLIDNGWMVPSGDALRWCEIPPACRHFWLDVDVLLGLAQRRVSETGEPEWARAGEWVKDYEYQGSRADPVSIHNEYRKIVLHDPQPEERHDAPEKADAAALEVATEADLALEGPGDRTSAGDADGLSTTTAVDRQSKSPPTLPNDAGLLLGDWSSANWLS
jgi:hypothetical protein